MQLKGEKIAERIKSNLNDKKCTPHLAVVFVGNSKASKSFITQKKEMCRQLGFKFSLKSFEKGVDMSKALETIQKLNSNPKIHGILPQLPLTELDQKKVFRDIKPEKDVDGLTPFNLGLLLRGRPEMKPGTVEAILEIFNHYDVNLKGENAVIVNNSNLIGKPLSMALTNRMATTTLCHTETRNLKMHTEKADILITATGQPDLITENMVKENAVVVDAGYAKENGKIQGDVKFDEVRKKASKITPNPGGVGPITVAATMRNLLKCYRMQKHEN